MNVLRNLLVVAEALLSLLLIGVVLLQKSKSEGLGLPFGSGMGESLFGSRTGNILTRATVVLTALFLINTLGLALLFSSRHERSLIQQHGVIRDLPVERAAEPAPAPPVPAIPAPEN